VQLGGLVRSQIATRELVLATPPAAAGELLADVDRDLAEALCEVRMLSATNVFLGFRDHDARDALTGGGFVQQEHGEDPFLAAFDCGQWFPRRGVVGKSVVRVVLDGDLLPFDRDPERLATAAETALRGYCDLAGPLLMRRVVHAFDAIPRAASLAQLAALRTSVRERLGITLT
jgi:protoporphyrinogen oxidase